jgi:predicted metal-dependent hydrolase
MIENGQPDGGFFLHYGGQRIPFRVEYRCRKHLAISVLPDQRVEVIAPAGTSLDAILSRVEKRAGWISKQLQFFEQYQPTQPGPSFVSGETHLYLGRQYRLKVTEGREESVRLVGKFFQVVARRRSDTIRVRDLLDGWYREHARRLFATRLEACVEGIASLDLAEPPKLIVRKMEKRWGSCTAAGTILLNLDLVKAPVHCIDYVIVHELCHIKEPNHGKAFYRLLTRCMPDWEVRRKRLEAVTLN